MRSSTDTEETVDRYADTIARICICHIKNYHDMEDISQEVFLKYMLSDSVFESEEHKKAWIIRVTINACKDHLRRLFRHKIVPIDELTESVGDMTENQNHVMEAVVSLPVKYRDVIYLHYYEGYSASEISEIIEKKENTVYSLLSRGRTMLEARLGGDELD